MAIVRFDPFRGFEGLARKMNSFINEFDKGVNFEYGSFSPRIDISEDEKSIYISAELPGMKKEDVKVTINDDNVLIIKGEKKRIVEEKEDEKKSYVRIERSYGEFTRSFMLPENVDTESINAKVEDGVLNISLNKKEPEKPKEIEVKID
ncbi:MAG: Hsp20/alpha crystallin family protein [Bacteroidota bacterium]